MFKRILTLVALFLFVSISVTAQSGKPLPADKVIKTAVTEAKASNKNVFVFFHASWCGWCKRLEKAINSDELKSIFDKNFVIARLDVLERGAKVDSLENPGGRDIMKKFGGEKSGLPFYVFLDDSGKKIADSNSMPKSSNIGYPVSDEEINTFVKVIGKSSKHLSKENIRILKKYLHDNAPKPSNS